MANSVRGDDELKDQLVECLNGLVGFLEDHADSLWVSCLRELRAKAEALQSGDTENLRNLQSEITSLYGGMGSLDDLCICPENGHRVKNVGQANSEYGELINRLYDIYQLRP